MNRFAHNIQSQFLSQPNRDYLYRYLDAHFANPAVTAWLQRNLNELATNFAAAISQELSLSDPLDGTSILDNVRCFNGQFLRNQIELIGSQFYQESTPTYTVNDGLPAGRCAFGAPNTILGNWIRDAGGSMDARDDSQADSGVPQPPRRGKVANITFCDQGAIGNSQYLDQFFNESYVLALNKDRRCEADPLAYTNQPLGWASVATDDRLLERKVFRKNEAGVENGIPRYEQRLYKRNLDRDITEGLRAGELGYKQRGYDMQPLYCRVDRKTAMRNMYKPPCDNSQLHLQYWSDQESNRTYA
jgi:hypothetical protein